MPDTRGEAAEWYLERNWRKHMVLSVIAPEHEVAAVERVLAQARPHEVADPPRSRSGRTGHPGTIGTKEKRRKSQKENTYAVSVR